MSRKVIVPLLGLALLGPLGTGCMTSGPLLQPIFQRGRAQPTPVAVPDGNAPANAGRDGVGGRRSHPPAPPSGLPYEKELVSFPPYVIEPPDILIVDVIRAVPKGPHLLSPLDMLWINVPQAPAAEPINGLYQVNTDGRVNLGLRYGSVLVADLTVEQAQEAIRKYLAQDLTKPVVTVALAQAGAVEQIRGQHLVRSDGTVGLGTYGSVRVVGMTLDEAKLAVEQHLSARLVKPEVSLDVFSYNSKFYYVILDQAGYGETMFRLPNTGKETVLDALAQVNGLPPVASKGRIWVARPAPAGAGCRDQILPVDYCGITRGGQSGTNYQLLPGDRLYVMASPLITRTTWLARALEPAERILGVTLLGASTVQTIQGNGFGGVGFGGVR